MQLASIFSLSKRMKLQRLEFYTSHLHWRFDMWSKVMFIDKLTFRLVRGGGSRGSGGLQEEFCTLSENK